MKSRTRSRFIVVLGLTLPCAGGAVLALGCADSSATASGAERAIATDLVVEPATLDMGDLVPDQTVTKRVKLTNRGSKPLTVTNAVADCSCTTPSWPSEPIAPGASVETDISIKPGLKQGVTLTKRVTFSIEGSDPVSMTVVGKVGLFIRQSTDMIIAPADDVAAPDAGTITLEGVEGGAFRIESVEPAFVSTTLGTTGLKHAISVDWVKWRELKKPLKITILTNHPKTPELVVMVRRTVPSKPPAPTAPKVSAAKVSAAEVSAAESILQASSELQP